MRVGFFQFAPQFGEVTHNLDKVVERLDRADADLIVLPELCASGYQFLSKQEAITLSGHALQCRVTTEDPANGFAPVHGRLDACRLPAGFGIRVDAGSAHTGAIVSAFYDSLLMKIVARGDSPDEAIGRMARALGETRVDGVASNLPFLERVITHPAFAGGKCTTTFVDETPELFEPVPAPDGAHLGYLEQVLPLAWLSSTPTTRTHMPVHALLAQPSGLPPSWPSTKPRANGSGASSLPLTRSGTTTARGGRASGTRPSTA